MATVHIERRTLYYPWVHFHSDDWVKRALLVFPGLFRMVATDLIPNDTSLVYDLRGAGLIRHAELGTANAQEAQQALQALIKEDLEADGDAFRTRYGPDSVAHCGQPSFQMHLGKASHNLKSFLLENHLAWTPSHPDHQAYSELHPDFGQAVMGTIAMACAEDAGLHIVGVDSPRGKDFSGELNSTLTTNDHAAPYKRFVRRESSTGASSPNANELFHVLITLNCDVSKLNADALIRLQDEREPLRNLKERVETLAMQIPPMRDPRQREEAFKDKANEIVKKWQADHFNLSNYAKEVFPVHALGGGLGKLAEKLAPGGAAALVALADAQIGLGLALATHLATAYGKVKSQERDSPWRYMTLAEEAGATFSVSTAQDHGSSLDLRR